jgi:hypothetical protein
MRMMILSLAGILVSALALLMHIAPVQPTTTSTDSSARFRIATIISEAEGLSTLKYGYIDDTGKVVIAVKFESASDFSDGRAAVEVNGKWGYIDTAGEFIFSPQLPDPARDFAAWEPGTAPVQPFSEGLAAVRVDGKWGFIDRSGKMIISPRFQTSGYECPGPFKESLAAVKIDGKTGYIDRTGKIVIKPQFEWARAFSDGLAQAAVFTDGARQTGFIDKTGKFVIAPQFTFAGDFHAGLASAATWSHDSTEPVPPIGGLIDKTGKRIIWSLPILSQVHEGEGMMPCFSEGLVAWKSKDKWGYMDETGKFVIAPQFEGAADFHEGLAAVTVGDVLKFIDKTGKVVIDTGMKRSPDKEYQPAGPFENGLAYISWGGFYGYIDRTGKWVWKRTGWMLL